MMGYVDPTLGPPRTEQQRALFAAVLKLGLSLQRMHADKEAVRLTGPGVHIVAASVTWINTKDFEHHGHRFPT